jgi:hypothetical protein
MAIAQLQLLIQTGKLRIWSRNQLPLESKFPMVKASNSLTGSQKVKSLEKMPKASHQNCLGGYL